LCQYWRRKKSTGVPYKEQTKDKQRMKDKPTAAGFADTEDK